MANSHATLTSDQCTYITEKDKKIGGEKQETRKGDSSMVADESEKYRNSGGLEQNSLWTKVQIIPNSVPICPYVGTY